MSEYQPSDNAPNANAKIAGKIMGTWIDQSILTADCRDADRLRQKLALRIAQKHWDHQ
jgi:hypothetical protein